MSDFEQLVFGFEQLVFGFDSLAIPPVTTNICLCKMFVSHDSNVVDLGNHCYIESVIVHRGDFQFLPVK